MVMRIRNQKGFTLIELLIVVAIIGIIAAIAVPGLLRARMSGNEASAIGSMRAINTAEQNYSQKCNGYATNLQELRVAGNFLSPDLTQGAGGAAVVKSGFTVQLAISPMSTAPLMPPPAGCVATDVAYYATGVALSNSTGTRGFGTDEQGTIWQNNAVGNPTPAPGPPPFAVTANITPIQ
jgi:prepilin-type N-terminal cleavage/methylation domain-containing protein